MPRQAQASNPEPDIRNSPDMNAVPEAVTFHDLTAAEWDQKYAQKSFRSRQVAFDRCLPPDQLVGRWLDAGCGSGPLARWLVRTGIVIQPVDLSPKMLEMFNRHRENHPAKAFLQEPQLADVRSLPFPPESFHGVLCSSVLEYVEDPSVVLTEFHRVLEPGGWLAISVPNRISIFRRGLETAFKVTRLFGKPWPAYIEFSIHRYTVPEFEEVLRSCGFEPRRFAGCGTSLPGLRNTPMGWSLLVFGAIKKA